VSSSPTPTSTRSGRRAAADTPESLLAYVGDVSLSPEERIAVTEHRVDPGEEVFVLGRGVDGDGAAPDVANLASPRHPFWLSPGSRREAIRDSRAIPTAALAGVLVAGVAVAAAALLWP